MSTFRVLVVSVWRWAANAPGPTHTLSATVSACQEKDAFGQVNRLGERRRAPNRVRWLHPRGRCTPRGPQYVC